MFRLIRSEIFRLRKRPQSWVMLMVMVAGVIATYAALAIATFVLSDATEPTRLTSPQNIFESGMQMVSGLAFVLVAIVAASIVGNEYSWGTIRPLVARARNRTSLLSAKIVTLLLFIISLLLVGLASCIICSVIGSFVVGADISIHAATIGDWFVSFLRLLIAQLPYAALGFFATLLARSTAVGIGVGIGIAILESSIWALVSLATDAFEPVRRFGLDHASNVIIHINAHIDAVSTGEVIRAIVTLLAWTALFVGGSFWTFQRRDVVTD